MRGKGWGRKGRGYRKGGMGIIGLRLGSLKKKTV